MIHRKWMKIRYHTGDRMDETVLDFFALSGDEGAFETLLFAEVILGSDSNTLFFVLFGLEL